MALIKENNDFGIPLSYWKITGINVDRRNNIALIYIDLFAKKGADRGISMRSFYITDENFDKYFSANLGFDDIYQAGYESIKMCDEYFKDAEDDEDELMKRNRK